MRSSRRPFCTALFVATIAVAGAIVIPAASAQIDPGQQAAQQAQQDAATAAQAAQQANDQAMRDAQQANQQAMRDAQQASMNSAPRGLPHPHYGRADKPSFSPRPGKFHHPVRVTISDPGTPKAEIFYTLDGSKPTTASARYTGPVLATTSTKLRAMARSPIYSPSRVSKAKYVIR